MIALGACNAFVVDTIAFSAGTKTWVSISFTLWKCLLYSFYNYLSFVFCLNEITRAFQGFWFSFSWLCSMSLLCYFSLEDENPNLRLPLQGIYVIFAILKRINYWYDLFPWLVKWEQIWGPISKMLFVKSSQWGWGLLGLPNSIIKVDSWSNVIWQIKLKQIMWTNNWTNIYWWPCGVGPLETQLTAIQRVPETLLASWIFPSEIFLSS